MRVLVPTDPFPGAQAAAELRIQQRRVAAVLGVLPRPVWDAHLADDARAALVATGHFPGYAGELDWTPREVAGHLRDSARVFTARLHRLLDGDHPVLTDFDPLDADRVAGYTATPPGRLLAELADAQDRLAATVAALTAEDLRHAGQAPSGATATVADLLRFLPPHQSDHAGQLEALAGARPFPEARP